MVVGVKPKMNRHKQAASGISGALRQGASIDLHRESSGGHGEIKSIQIEPDLNVRVSSACAEYEAGALHQRANLTSCTEHELLSEELSIMSHDPAFERALQRMTIWTPRS